MFALSVLVYAGALAILAGLLGVVRPIRRIGLRSRRRAVIAVMCGAASCALAWLWPTPTLHAAQVASAIDEVMPAYQFVEHHETMVHAAPSAVFAAIRPVTAGEIRFFRTLTWIRHPRLRETRESILAAPDEKPLLAVALSSGFTLVKEVPDREMVIAIRVAPSVRGVMNFLTVPVQDGTLLSTETRVLADSPEGLRAFTAYWRVIYPGSSLIRTQWLGAIKRRAEIQSPR
jgi:hypothetical protein